MTQIKYITGPLKSGKTAKVIQETVDVLRSGQVVGGILPSRDHLGYIKREILRSQPVLAPGQLFLGTFYAWAERILDECHYNFQTVQPAEEWLYLHDLLKQSLVSNYHSFSGYIQILQDIFKDFRESGLTLAELELLAKNSGERELIEWVRLFNKLRQNYRRSSAGPSGESLTIALEILKNKFKSNLGELLIIDGFYEFTPIQHKILQALTPLFTKTICTSIFDSSHPIYEYCQNRPGWLGSGETVMLSERTISSDPLRFLNSKLFKELIKHDNFTPPNAVSNWKNEWNTPVKIVQCPSRRSEIETAARTIKRWLSEGMNPAKIGITFRGSYDYRSLIKLIFPNFGIPVAMEVQNLLLSEPAQLITRIVNLNRENFSRPVFIDLLRLPVLQRFYGADLLQELEIYSSEWGLPSVKSDWTARCRQQIEYLQFVLQIDREENDRERRDAQLQIKHLQAIQPILTRLIEELSLPESAEWSEYHYLLIKILERYYPPDQPDEAQKILPIKSILERLVRLRDFHTKTSLEELAGILPHFLDTGENEATLSSSGILCANLMDARAWDVDGLILLGLIDGEFPAIHPENPLFRKDLRSRLNQLANQPIFAEAAFDLSEEKFLLYLLTTRVNQRLLITYPESDNKGRALPVSPFIDEILACQPANTNQKIVEWEAIPAGQVLPDSVNCGSDSDLLQIVLAEKTARKDIEKLVSLIDRKIFDELAINLNCERRRLAGDGIRNGVLPGLRFYPEFLAKPLSTTKIQNYVDCPFAYLCAHIWNIEISREPQIGLDALTEGLLIHKLLEQFVQDFLSGQPQNWSDFLEVADDSFLNGLIARIDTLFRPKLYFVPDLLWEQVLNNLMMGLRNFVEEERHYCPTGFAPILTEEMYALDSAFLIGNDPTLPVTITGKIDRIDHNASGERFLVIDYKRSSSGIIDIVNGAQSGAQFQIPLYLLILLKHRPNEQVGGAFYYSFNDGKRTRGFLVDSKLERTSELGLYDLNELLNKTQQNVTAILEQIYRGNFSLLRRNENRCRGNECDFYDLCRIASGQKNSHQQPATHSHQKRT